MRKILSGIGLALVFLLCLDPVVHGQKETEIYIPVGQSPGLSHRYSIVGEIKAVDAAGRSVEMAGPGADRIVTLTGRTRIWLDRTPIQMTNLPGRFEDLVPGRTIEVKFVDPQRKRSAAWIKIRITSTAD